MPANTPIQIQGYTFADGRCTFDGLELPGVTAINFPVSQAKTNNPGLGKFPVSRSRGGVDYSGGSMDLDIDTMNILRALSPDNLLPSIPMGILIFTLENYDGTKEIWTFNFFEFISDGLEGSQGDENLTKSIDIIFAGMVKTKI